jgi:DNA-binding transcriptional LysR family regulator
VPDCLAKGQMINLFPAWSDELFPLYALFPSRHLPAAKVRAFFDFVLAVVQTNAGRLQAR